MNSSFDDVTSTDHPGKILNVSDTALWVAVYRDLESKRADALFQDPYAGILAGKKGALIVKDLGSKSRNTQFAIVVRTAVLDEMIQATIKNKNIDTVLNLAAGLDTRPYRLPLDPKLRWIEVDFPAITEYKTEKLKEFKPVCQLERVVQDLTDAQGRKNLLTRINSESKNILVITEGLLLYLEESVVKGLASDLLEQKNVRSWIFDYATWFVIKMINKRNKKQLVNSPMIFGVDPELKFFENLQWKVEDVRFTMKEARRLNRMPPYSFMWKFFQIFMSAEKKKFYQRMSGYALLKPNP